MGRCGVVVGHCGVVVGHCGVVVGRCGSFHVLVTTFNCTSVDITLGMISSNQT